MDSHAHEQQQKEFLASLFTEHTDHLQQNFDTSQQNGQMFPFSSPSPRGQQGMSTQHPTSLNHSQQMNMDLLGNMMQISEIDTQSNGTMPSQAPFNPQSILEQQFKLAQLQQLQQLQNQIFQQQIALISGQTSGIMQGSPVIDAQRNQTNTGLLTPGPSSEIHAQQLPIEFISPIRLNNNYMNAQATQRNQSINTGPSLVHSGYLPDYGPPRGSSSAPEHIAFQPNSNRGLSADLDFDISPLTSPWLGAHHSTQFLSNKRTASSSGDEGNSQPSRKRQSPAIRPTNPVQGKKIYRNSKSAANTPLLRSTRSRKGSIVGDTPSPVDLSMPPPKPPSNQVSTPNTPVGNTLPLSPDSNPQLTPVTPASIMNLGRLGINNSKNNLTTIRQNGPGDPMPKGSPRHRATMEPSMRSRPTKKAPTGSLPSPGLKAILPAGTTPPLSLGPSGLPGPVVQVRKTSHKAAEQKRRDSLKTTFDDLRGLLPPIPLPSDEKYPDEPVLPGALPPRGPPKAGGEGPNKGVSKLQLLMCANDFLRQLKARVERRDEEIDKLRREVRRLRRMVDAAGTLEESMEELDLDRDLDAVEALGGRFGSGTSTIGADDDIDDDPGED